MHGDIHQHARKPKSKLTKWEWFGSFLKTFSNVISVWDKLFLSNYTDYKPPAHLNHLFNPNMNNVMSIDYSNKDITESDGVLPRWT